MTTSKLRTGMKFMRPGVWEGEGKKDESPTWISSTFTFRAWQMAAAARAFWMR